MTFKSSSSHRIEYSIQKVWKLVIYRVLRKFEDIIQKYPEYLKR